MIKSILLNSDGLAFFVKLSLNVHDESFVAQYYQFVSRSHASAASRHYLVPVSHYGYYKAPRRQIYGRKRTAVH